MAKIVIDARLFSTGAGRYSSRLLQHLQSIDTINTYIVILTPKDAKEWKPSAPNFRVVTTKYKEFTLGEQLGFAWQLYRLKADLVHFCMVQQPLLYFKKSVTTMHDLTTARFYNPTKHRLIFFIKQQVYKAVNIWVAHKNTYIFTPTKYVKNDVSSYAHISKNKIIVTYEAGDYYSQSEKPVASLQGKDFIMYVGRAQPHKNLGKLIEAYAELRLQYPHLLLAIAGKKDAMHDIHIQTAKKLGVESGVIFTDFVSDAQLKWMFQHTKSYVFPSLSEGFGLPALAAMAHGAPVASSNATCLPEVYKDAAHYFNPHDSHDIARAIHDIISSKTLQQGLIKKGILVAKTYSWKTMATQTHNIYIKAMQK